MSFSTQQPRGQATKLIGAKATRSEEDEEKKGGEDF